MIVSRDRLKFLNIVFIIFSIGYFGLTVAYWKYKSQRLQSASHSRINQEFEFRRNLAKDFLENIHFLRQSLSEEEFKSRLSAFQKDLKADYIRLVDATGKVYYENPKKVISLRMKSLLLSQDEKIVSLDTDEGPSILFRIGQSIFFTNTKSKFSELNRDQRLFILEFVKDITIYLAILFFYLWLRFTHSSSIHNEERYRNLADKQNYGVFEIDKDSKLLFLNQGMLKMFDMVDLEGTKYLANLFDGSSTVTIQKMLEGKIESRQEMTAVTNHGDTFPAALFIERLESDSGLVKGYYGSVIDLTEERDREERRIQAQKLQGIGHLTAGIAHDFNNLLGGVLTNTSLLKLELEAKRTNKSKSIQYLEEISGITYTARDTINKLLTFSKLKKIERKPLDFFTVVYESFMVVKVLLKKINNLSLEGEDGLKSTKFYINGDPTQIHLILQNLIINSAHALATMPIDEGSEEAFIRVRASVVDLDRPRVNIFSEIPIGRYACLEIADSGPGISKENLDKIFLPYFTTKPPGEGTGLGLSTVWGIVENHQGYIDVETREGWGTRFMVYFPIQEEIPVVEAVQGEEKFEDVERVMIVDDEFFLAKPLSILLKDFCGIRSDIFLDPNKALESYKEFPEKYDVILSDMVMPTMSGLEFFKKVKEINPNCTFLIVTGYANSDDVSWLLDHGANGLLVKPYSHEDLLKFFPGKEDSE